MENRKRKSAFNAWSTKLSYTELMHLIQLHKEKEMRSIQENLENTQVVIFEDRVICYKRKRVKVIQ
jgi:hypothetical protein